jgi:hypothetical protein
MGDEGKLQITLGIFTKKSGDILAIPILCYEADGWVYRREGKKTRCQVYLKLSKEHMIP